MQTKVALRKHSARSRVLPSIVESEHGNGLLQSGCLLYKRRALLCNLVHLTNGLIHSSPALPGKITLSLGCSQCCDLGCGERVVIDTELIYQTSEIRIG